MDVDIHERVAAATAGLMLLSNDIKQTRETRKDDPVLGLRLAKAETYIEMALFNLQQSAPHIQGAYWRVGMPMS